MPVSVGGFLAISHNCCILCDTRATGSACYRCGVIVGKHVLAAPLSELLHHWKVSSDFEQVRASVIEQLGFGDWSAEEVKVRGGLATGLLQSGKTHHALVVAALCFLQQEEKICVDCCNPADVLLDSLSFHQDSLKALREYLGLR